MNKKIKTKELFDCQTPYLIELFDECEYPWEMLPKIKGYIQKLIENGLEGFTEIADGVWVGENVKIHPSAVIEAPAIIGANTEIRPSAFLRGNVITGSGCVIGNSSELKNCVLLNTVQVPKGQLIKSNKFAGNNIVQNFNCSHALRCVAAFSSAYIIYS